MNYKIVKYGKYRERRNFSRVKANVELPNLIEVQTDSFDWFIKEGLKELFVDLSPITNVNETIALHFGEYEFGEPKNSIMECKEKDITYSRPLHVNVKLVVLKNGEGEDSHTQMQIKEQKVFMGEFPMMTPEGTFVINGAERVVVSQIVRSAGAFFSEAEDDKKLGNNRIHYAGQVIPTRGAWLEYEMGSKDILYVKLDRSKKIFLTTFLRAMGLEEEDIYSLFGKDELLENTFEKDTKVTIDDAIREVYDKIRPGEGENATVEGARNFIISRLFEERRYDLAEVGRYKINQKLDVLQRARGLRSNQDILKSGFTRTVIDELTGEVIEMKDDKIEFLVKKGEIITDEAVEYIYQNPSLREQFRQKVDFKARFDYEDTYIEVIKVLNDFDEEIIIVGNNNNETRNHIASSDILASVSYYLNLYRGIGTLDDIDHLGNRRLRLIGELLKNQFRVGLAKMEKNIKDRMSTKETIGMTPQNLVNNRPLTSSLKEFFGSSQLSQFMQQTNPLDELTHKRRLSALGPGGLTRDRAGFEVRDVHVSHYGRICPIETPEGQNIGLINSLACYAKVNKYGFIETPYLPVKDGKVVFEKNEEGYDTNYVYMTADEEYEHYIAEANSELAEDGSFVKEKIVARHHLEPKECGKEIIDFIDVSPKQILSVSTSSIPFLEHDDANRTLMGSNMQRQAIPLLKPEAPLVGTGIEYKTAHDSGTAVVCKHAGVVDYVDAKKVIVRLENGEYETYNFQKFMRSNQGTCINQTPIVTLGEKLKKGDIIADGPSMDKGELALGRNVTIAFMTWNGYNYEDAVIMNEKLVKEDIYTSIHIEKYELEARDTKLGKEEFTREIPNVGDEGRYLDANGIIIPGSIVKEGDILIGKVTPKGQTELSPEERLLMAIFNDKAREVRDTSLRVPHGGGGIVQCVKHFTRENDDELAPGVNEVVRVFIVQKRKITEGDKMSGRHGNKGVISKILPQEDMPYMEDGTPVDIMLNPLGVPSRMNIGQVLEVHLGMAAKKLGIYTATPVFDGCSNEDLVEIMKEANMTPDGKVDLYDGRTGEKFDNKITVGVMYMIKLDHMVDDKLHARSVGHYTLVTQQPMGGKAQNGGQRFGEMEVWALEAYGAAYTLQEMLTVKSDDIIGRNKVFKAIADGKEIPEPNLPESFRVLTRELRSLGIHVELISRETGENEVDKSLVDGDVEDYITKLGM